MGWLVAAPVARCDKLTTELPHSAATGACRMTNGRVNPSATLGRSRHHRVGQRLLQLYRARTGRGRGAARRGHVWARAARSCAPPGSSPAGRPRTNSSCARHRWKTPSGGKTTRRWRPTAFDRAVCRHAGPYEGPRLFRAGSVRRRRPGPPAGCAHGDRTGLARPVHPPHAAPPRAGRAGQLCAGMDDHQLPQLQGRSGPARLPHRRR